MSRQKIYICTGRWCHELGATRMFKQVKKFFKKDRDVSVEQCRCLGYCEQGVNAMKNGCIYHELTEENVLDKLSVDTRKERKPKEIDFCNDFLGDL